MAETDTLPDYLDAVSRLRDANDQVNDKDENGQALPWYAPGPLALSLGRPFKWLTNWFNSSDRSSAAYDLTLQLNRMMKGVTLNLFFNRLQTQIKAAGNNDAAKHDAWKTFYSEMLDNVTIQYHMDYEKDEAKVKLLEQHYEQTKLSYDQQVQAHEQLKQQPADAGDSAQEQQKQALKESEEALDEANEKRKEEFARLEEAKEKLQEFRGGIQHGIARVSEYLNELARAHDIKLRFRTAAAITDEELRKLRETAPGGTDLRLNLPEAGALNPYYLVDTSDNGYDDWSKKRDLALRGIAEIYKDQPELGYEYQLESKSSRFRPSRRKWGKIQVGASLVTSILVGAAEGIIGAMFVTFMPVLPAILIFGIPGALLNFYLFHNAAVPTMRDFFTKERVAVRDQDGKPEYDENGQLKTKLVRRLFLRKNKDGEYEEISARQQSLLKWIGIGLSLFTGAVYGVLSHSSTVAAFAFLAGTAVPWALAGVLALSLAALFAYNVILFVKDEKYKDLGKFWRKHFGENATKGQKLSGKIFLIVAIPLFILANVVTFGILLKESIKFWDKMMGLAAKLSLALGATIASLASIVNALFYSRASISGTSLLEKFGRWLGSWALRPVNALIDWTGLGEKYPDNAVVKFIKDNAATSSEEPAKLTDAEIFKLIQEQARELNDDGHQEIKQAMQANPEAIRNYYQTATMVTLAGIVACLPTNSLANGFSGQIVGVVAPQVVVPAIVGATVASAGCCWDSGKGETTGSMDFKSVSYRPDAKTAPHVSLAQALHKQAELKAAAQQGGDDSGNLSAPTVMAPATQRQNSPGNDNAPSAAAANDSTDANNISPRSPVGHPVTLAFNTRRNRAADEAADPPLVAVTTANDGTATTSPVTPNRSSTRTAALV